LTVKAAIVSQEVMAVGDYSQSVGLDILARCPAPTTAANLLALKAWAQAEGGLARWNPFNTERPWPGAIDYNPQGVKSYPSEQAGINATVETLQQGNMAGIMLALKRGSNAYDVAYAIEASPWGTGPRVVEVLNGWGVLQVPPWYIHGPYLEGSTGTAVHIIQAKVGVAQDGVYGPLTKAAVERYQAAHHLTADGIVGPMTARVMGP
jgi:peptidoglycan hydrolase-like protein with peptidoglycan-binding domain